MDFTDLQFEGNAFNLQEMLQRIATSALSALRRHSPAVAIYGPRQSGKTTLAKLAAPELPYVNFESPLERARYGALEGTNLLINFPGGAILDEIQEVPELLSFLQVAIDESPTPGKWVLTGSRQVDLRSGVSQSLAGRVSTIHLWPLSYSECRPAGRAPKTLAEAVLLGGYPRLFDERRKVDVERWLSDYADALIQRDLQQVLRIDKRLEFDQFLRLCAARSGTLLNVSELASTAGISPPTATAWLDGLERCFVIHRVLPYHRNFGKRLSKRPKLYFLDSGLACSLLGIQSASQLQRDPAYGNLVETWCVSELVKSRQNRAMPPRAHHWRTNDGIAIDSLIEEGGILYPFEIKASHAAHPGDLSAVDKLRSLESREAGISVAAGTLIYAGDQSLALGRDRAVPWFDIDRTVPPFS